MNDILMWSPIFLMAVNLVLLIRVLAKVSSVRQENAGEILQKEFRASREEADKSARGLREEVSANQKNANDTVVRVMGEMRESQQNSLSAMEKAVKELSEKNEALSKELRDTMDTKMKSLQESNEKKLEQIQKTVDEQLQSALEKRIGESFKIVSERLEAVQRGLGEMQTLATGVGDLKRVLTNVKDRGTWGEVQLGAILEQILAPEQYDKNVKVRPASNELVEYAIRLPGDDANAGPVWLPIDAKFPQEDYQRLLDATERADQNAIEQSLKALNRSLENSARDISEKYIEPPATTNFAIMFLPTEGLYAEALRQPELVSKLQQTWRVTIAGPTTLAALLNSLRMGFQTLAIQRHSGEIWQVLAAVKTEFGKFSGVLAQVKRQLNTASTTIGRTETRTRAMERKLRGVEVLPEEEASKLLELPEAGPMPDDAEFDSGGEPASDSL